MGNVKPPRPGYVRHELKCDAVINGSKCQTVVALNDLPPGVPPPTQSGFHCEGCSNAGHGQPPCGWKGQQGEMCPSLATHRNRAGAFRCHDHTEEDLREISRFE